MRCRCANLKIAVFVFTGNSWNFTDGSDPCVDAWQGVTCNASSTACASTECAVVSMDLTSLNLNGTLPSGMGRLAILYSLVLSSNSIRGTLPVSIVKLKTLYRLDISSNAMDGSIPTAIDEMVALAEIRLNTNSLTGSLPSSMGNMVALKKIALHANTFEGSIPSSFGNLTNVSYLALYSNRLSGSLPPQMEQMISLEFIYLMANRFMGQVPTGLNKLSALQHLYLYENKLTGSIPSSLGLLSVCNTIALYYNSMGGSVPSTLGSLSSLRLLHLARNDLTGSIPSSLGEVLGLQSLYLDDNNITGTLPTNLGKLSRLAYFYVDKNSLYGTLPAEYAGMRSMYVMHFSNNSFNGPIPAYIGDYTRLNILTLYTNEFTGTIPSALGKLSSSIEIMYLYDNNLRGTIPHELCRLSKLKSLYLATNALTGTIPYYLGSGDMAMPNMLEIDFSFNRLSGTIPLTMAGFSMINTLKMSHNDLSGTLPSVLFSSMPLLETVSLSANRLSGRLPSTMSTLTDLSQLFLYDNLFTGDPSVAISPNQVLLDTLDISDNAFSSSISPVFFQLSSLTTLAAAKNCFTGSLPDNICDARALNVLVFDGLSSGDACLHRIPLTRAYLTYNLKGGIPDCLFEMPNLALLHLSGNGFFGTLVTSLPPNSKLTNLVLSHNGLVGSVDESIQKHKFLTLDLSYNRIDGSCDHISADPFSFAGYNQSVFTPSITLKENRLSGKISHSLHQGTDINILSGNLLGCSGDGNPPHDPDSDNYVCGSEDLDWSLMAWAILLGVCSIMLVAALVVASRNNSLSSMNSLNAEGVSGRGRGLLADVVGVWGYVRACIETAGQCRVIQESRHLSLFLDHLRGLRHIAILLTAFILLVTGPISVGLKNNMLHSDAAYSTHTTQYSYTFSDMYLAGYAAAIVTLMLWLITLALFVWRSLSVFPRSNFQNLLASTRIMSGSSGLVSVTTGATTSAPGTDVTSFNSSLTSEGKSLSVPNLWFRRIMQSEKVALSIVIFVNALIVLAANGTFVYGLLSDVSEYRIFFQSGLVVFNIVWGHLSIRFIFLVFSYQSRRSEVDIKRHYLVNFLLIFIPLFNSIIIPLISSALIDTSCFQKLFVPDDDVVATYSYPLCSRRLVDFNSGVVTITCLAYDDSGRISTSFASTFRYNYDCSSALLKNYVPVMVIGLLVKCFGSALLYAFVTYTGHGGRFISQTGILFPESVFERSDDTFFSVSLFDSVKVISFLRQYIATLLTFGLASPVVSVAVLVTVCVQTYTWEYFIGRLVLSATSRVSGQGEAERVRLGTTTTTTTTTGASEVDGEDDIVNVRNREGTEKSRDSNIRMVSVASVRSTFDNGHRFRPDGERHIVHDPRSCSSSSNINNRSSSSGGVVTLNPVVFGGRGVDCLEGAGAECSDTAQASVGDTSSRFGLDRIYLLLDINTLGSCRANNSWVIQTLLVSTIFFACIAFDMSGDQLGWKLSLWVFAMTGCSFVLLVTVFSYLRSRHLEPK
jgi:Leucine-rich repeat (LRR) protein